MRRQLKPDSEAYNVHDINYALYGIGCAMHKSAKLDNSNASEGQTCNKYNSRGIVVAMGQIDLSDN